MTTDRSGADWELGEAARKLSTVLGVEGAQAEALRLALSDHAAAVGSKSTQMIAALFTPMMETQQGTRADIAVQQRSLDTLVTTMQHIGATVVQIAEAQKKSDTRLAKLEQRMGTFEERMEGSEADRKDMRERLERVEAVDAELARLREEIVGVKEIIANRPAQREAEYNRIADRAADEAIKRLEARGDGEG